MLKMDYLTVLGLSFQLGDSDFRILREIFYRNDDVSIFYSRCPPGLFYRLRFGNGVSTMLHVCGMAEAFPKDHFHIILYNIYYTRQLKLRV